MIVVHGLNVIKHYAHPEKKGIHVGCRNKKGYLVKIRNPEVCMAPKRAHVSRPVPGAER